MTTLKMTVAKPRGTAGVINGMTSGGGAFYTPYIPKMSLILGESRIHGARYYTVKPVFADWPELEVWAIKTFGSPSSVWDKNCGRWYMNDSMFWFRNEADRTMFVLRWS